MSATLTQNVQITAAGYPIGAQVVFFSHNVDDTLTVRTGEVVQPPPSQINDTNRLFIKVEENKYRSFRNENIRDLRYVG